MKRTRHIDVSGFVVTVPLTDMQAAYYGYSVIETRVWVNGVVGLRVEIK